MKILEIFEKSKIFPIFGNFEKIEKKFGQKWPGQFFSNF